ncbi:1-acyl-sn-glycerol-3-phosphate acyltransferase [Acidipropionibacterium jensenii]|uniref:1-acyl-sn-glycerol-3-phosphate acyltransferase n=1 Tax=Acidipropionibacterium jensenii TaxID=1749 RepID=A0A448NXY3_9ACTN|nr:1-acyl-sn-glycerol-3-phosphate acyltransferase [Acidipropionibacterium jensenii]
MHRITVPRLKPLASPADRPGPIFIAGVGVLLPAARLLTRFDHHGQANLPASGGALIVSNHVSNYDPVVLGAFLVENGRWPHWMAKKELFDVPVVGFVARHADQIPVDRKAPGPEILAAARRELIRGMTLVIYPEGTITADPLHWPMTGHTGAARLAMDTGVPVIPVGQWGPQEVMGYKDMTFPRVLPRRTMHLHCGPAVDLAQFRGRSNDQQAVREATERIMEAIDSQVELARGETAPDSRFDIRTGQRVPKDSLRRCR